MEALLRNAERILDTAALAGDGWPQSYTICASGFSGIRVSTERSDWSLPALAAETGASAVFRVERRGGEVRVEAWSSNAHCTLSRTLPGSVPEIPWAAPFLAGAPVAFPLLTA